MRRLAAVAALALLALLLASCEGTPTFGASTSLANWTTYHRSDARSGRTDRPVGTPLRAGWRKALHGAVYGEPLVVGSTLIAATEQDEVYGLDARSGAVRWHTKVGTPVALRTLPCGNIDPLGITGTPAYTAATHQVYVVAETAGGTHTLWALDARTGVKRWHRTLDTQRNRSKLAEQQRSALMVTGGRVIVTFGGLAGDCGNYVGYVTSTPVTGRGATTSYAVPTAREAGMWAPGGPARGPNGHVYVASGNGAEKNGRWDGSDSVIELTASTLHRVSVFAPATWRDDNARDLDLGSSSPVPVPAVGRQVIAGKRGTVYLLTPTMHGVGSAVTRLSGCHAFGGPAVAGRTVLMPCLGPDGIRALTVGPRSLHWSWTAPGIYGSPVIAGSRVYVADRDSGDLVVLALATGRVVQRLHAGSLTHFPSSTVSGDWVFVPTLSGVTAFRGP